jgi:predicted NAD/FAD-dependent oxidoreductase
MERGQRWRYSQTRKGAEWADINPDGTRLLICGDALCAKSRVEQAYDSGLRAARQLLGIK